LSTSFKLVTRDVSNEEPSVNPAPGAGLNAEAAEFAPPADPLPHAGNLRLREFWPENPRGWFAMAEAQFLLRRVSTGVDKYCHVLTTLPGNSFSLKWYIYGIPHAP
jgi:hypothetical protein